MIYVFCWFLKLKTIVENHELEESILDGLKENIEWTENNLVDVTNWLGEVEVGGGDDDDVDDDSAATTFGTFVLILGALLLQKVTA